MAWRVPLDCQADACGEDGELLGIGSLFVMDAMVGNPAATRRLPGNMFVSADSFKP